METEPEFVVPPVCGHRVYMKNSVGPKKILGFCTRERGHAGGCSHLIERRVKHNLHVRNGVTKYEE